AVGFLEDLQVLNRVATDADHLRAHLRELRPVVPEGTGLLGTTARHSGRVEVDDEDLVPDVVAAAPDITIDGRRLERGCLVAHVQASVLCVERTGKAEGPSQAGHQREADCEGLHRWWGSVARAVRDRSGLDADSLSPAST